MQRSSHRLQLVERDADMAVVEERIGAAEGVERLLAIEGPLGIGRGP
jgi:hypothetical protein